MKVLEIPGQTTGEALFSISVFAMSLAATALFGYYLVTEPTRLTEVWEWTRSLNILVQGVIWLLFLPWMLALWFWTMPLSLPIRLVLVIGTLGFTTWLVFPWKA
ncbi:MAG: hypothetical protein QMC79_08575 [Anaerosomatales bacterium]|nr:hypothetical protein [Anaerosomatales bacterium]